MDRIIELAAEKAKNTSVKWYPYSDLYGYLGQIREAMVQDFDARFTKGAKVLDVGTADGDLAFYLESVGCRVDVLENPQTNYNNCLGIQALKKALRSSVNITYQDVDFEFKLKDEYDIVVACGILYHLRNPLAFLIHLAKHSRHLVLSTRTATRLPDGSDISKSSVAYLLGHDESKNGDPTNYWIFSPIGLERCLKRSGWVVKNSMVEGEADGDPIEKDQRSFVYCERVQNHEELTKHHRF